MQRYAPFLLSILAGFLFSNHVYADPPPLEALTGQTKTVDSGVFSITSTPFSGVLSANGGTITTAPPGLTLNAPTLQGADVRSGGTITITDSTFNVGGGLRIGTGGGTIEATNLKIVLGPGGQNGAGAQVAGSTITLHGGSITSAPGSVIQSTGVLAENHATLIADGTAMSNVSNTNTEPRKGFNPVTNMWCAQTRKASTAIANKDPTIAI